MNNYFVLIIADDQIILDQLKRYLKNIFLEKIILIDNIDEAIKIYNKEKNNIDIIIVDIDLPGITRFDINKILKDNDRLFEMIIITEYNKQNNVLQALRNGAIDYIEKPFKSDDIYISLGRAIEKINLRKNVTYNNTILTVDDEALIANRIKNILEKEGYNVITSTRGRDAITIIENNKIDLIIIDMNLHDILGTDVLKYAKTLYSDIEGIVITAYDEFDLAIKALKIGTFDYLSKPVESERLIFSVKKCIEKINLYRSNLFKSRELKISSEIIFKINEELEKKYDEKEKELNKTQAQLFQTSKLATLGEMAAGLAHEINQPLGGISLVLQNLCKLMEVGKLNDIEIISGLNDIEQAVKRMINVIRHIRTFARQDTMEFKEVDINRTIDDALSLIGEQLRLHGIIIEKRYNFDLSLIKGEPYQLEQVWINLLSNARDALDEKDKMINANILSLNDYKKVIVIKTYYDVVNDKIIVEFYDNGIGMNNEVIEKAFQPFYTTKEVGKATGLGLAISYGIIENHKGKINIKSEKNNGTSIIVEFKDNICRL